MYTQKSLAWIKLDTMQFIFLHNCQKQQWFQLRLRFIFTIISIWLNPINKILENWMHMIDMIVNGFKECNIISSDFQLATDNSKDAFDGMLLIWSKKKFPSKQPMLVWSLLQRMNHIETATRIYWYSKGRQHINIDSQ